ncbi:TAXI family TRAP transporter solute-binding subunit [Streptomyces polyrhachis]|uniref:TAXI family TRAP transporter solute-binding subunit n=1 Tax=Streptomyces polyrhachis TaxID=1282885 RepID=A0ABW2GD26_9ACTN
MDPTPRPRRAIRTGLALAAALTAAALVLWWLAPGVLPGGGERPSGKVVFSTGAPKGVYARYGDMLRDDLAADLPELRVDLQPSEGSLDNMERIATGRADFAIATADAVAEYRSGHRPGWQRLRAVARLYDDYIQLVVPARSGIRSAQDLAGRTVGVGTDKSGVQLIAKRLLAAAGLDMAEDVQAVRQPIGTMTDLLRRGEIEAFFWSGGLPTAAVGALADRTEIRLVPLNNLLGPLHKQSPSAHYYRSAVMPADAYPELRDEQAVSTIAVANLLVTTERTDPVLTEAITREVIKSRDTIAKEVHAAQLVDLRTAVFTDPLALHEGAERYYRDEKP